MWSIKKLDTQAMNRRLRSEPVALVLHTSEADWAIAYQAHLPSLEWAGHLHLFHRPKGAARYHPQYQREPADVRKARGLRRLIRYVWEHDIDYRQGDPAVFRLSWMAVHDLVRSIGMRHFVDLCLSPLEDLWLLDDPRPALEELMAVADALALICCTGDAGEEDCFAVAEFRAMLESAREGLLENSD